MKSRRKPEWPYTSAPYSGHCLKKNVPDEKPIGYDYSKGTLYYEEIRVHLSRCDMNNKAYQMGMDIILVYGLKHFLDKFRRKDCRQDYYEIAPETPAKVTAHTGADGTDGELVSLLSVMIQAAGKYRGTGQKNHN